MKKLFGMMAVAAILAACADEEAIEGDGGTGGGGEVINPSDLAVGDLDTATFNATAQTMTVSITLDGDNANQIYERAIQYDTAGYQAYTIQDDPLDRMFMALGGVSEDGVTTAVVAMDGGQFLRYFGGAVFNASSYSAPSGGLSSYAGTYAGLTNVGTREGTMDSVAPEELLPTRPTRTQGLVFINADFSDNQLNGAIYDRTALDGSSLAVGTLYLIPGNIAADGSFSGTVEQFIGTATAATGVGTYTGTFGGNNASGIAGGVYIQNFDPDRTTEEERGIFVLNQCGTAGESPDCGTFNVDDLNSD